MKSLRVLTGQHAGAQIVLAARSQRIGRDAEADIRISDWPSIPTLIVEDQTGAVRWCAAPLNGEASDAAPLPDFVPVRFGDVVLCIGPADSPWPSDVSLLSKLMHRPDPVPSESMWTARKRWVQAMAVMVALAGLGAAAKSVADAITVSEVNTPPPLTIQVRQALNSPDADRLRIVTQGERVAVEGLLDTVADVNRVRDALRVFEGSVRHRYGAASDIARTIAESVGGAGIQVVHQGGGVFLVTGETSDVPQLLKTLQRLAADLDANVARIDVQVAEAAAKAKPVPDAVVYIGASLQYLQRGDGSRHVSVLERATDEGVGTAPPPSGFKTRVDVSAARDTARGAPQ